MSEFILNAIKSEVFGGVLAASLVAAALLALKSVPGELWQLIKWRFTCSLTVFNEDSAFERVSEWVASLPGAQRCRQLRLTTVYDQSSETDRELLSPGVGMHLFWYHRRPVVVYRQLPDKAAVGGYKRLEDIQIVTIGGSADLLHDLVTEIKEARLKMRGSTIDVYLHRHRWRIACRKPKRGLDTIVLAAGQKESIVRDIEEFISARAWYAARGVPYRRGYLFEGEPGSGKTTMALAVASHLSRPIYALNIGSLANDDALIDAVADVPEHSVLLIEDIDAAKASARRSKPQAVTQLGAITQGGAPVVSEEEREVSLSALLNVIDGVFSKEGRVLIMTTNYPERIDPALLRPGRADRRERFGALGKADVLAMCERFFPRPEEAHAFANSVRVPIAAAELQELLVQETRRVSKLEAAE